MSSSRVTSRSDQLESVRSTMSTGRVQTALAALAAEKVALESKLIQIEAELEQENRKIMSRPRPKK